MAVVAVAAAAAAAAAETIDGDTRDCLPRPISNRVDAAEVVAAALEITGSR